MHISTVSFIKSSANFTQCPTAKFPEFAFIGRSNVGKSSLINRLCHKKGLAKTSGKPGKTQLINHYMVNNQWYLVDLPGYGYAKVSKTSREAWQKLIKDYFLNRKNLCCILVLIDARLEPQPIDVEFINWLGTNNLPLALVYTKVDKEGPNHAQKMISLMKKQLLTVWQEAPDVFVTSAETGFGIADLQLFISTCIAEYKP